MNNQSTKRQFRKLLIIDDNKDITDIIEEIARVAGYDVQSINDYKEVHSAYRKFSPDLIFVDLDLGVDKDMDMSERGYDGLAIFDFLAENHCEAKIIVISGMGKEKIEVTANIGREMKLDVIGAITKPFSIDKIDQLLLNLKR